MNNIKIVRLKDGEDIITEYVLDEITQTVIMDNPMSLFFKRVSEGKSAVLLSPWLPIELIDSSMISIDRNDILTIIDPKPSLIEYYSNMVRECNETLHMNRDLIDDALERLASSFDEEDEPEDVYDKLMSKLKNDNEGGSGKLH